MANSILDLLDLDGSNGFVIDGTNAGDSSGVSVSSAGDINDDGINDLIIGAYNADPNGNNGAGQSYIVFGNSNGFSASFELSSLDGSNGFVLNGIDANDRSGHSVSSAGDINGDGIDDLIVGASAADPNGKTNAGESYVIFGSSNGFNASLELSSLNGSNGFVLNGINVDDYSGGTVSGAGDINSDGIDDLIVGTYLADPNGKTNAGQSYVVFGSSNGFNTSLEFSSLNGSNGFVLNGINGGHWSGGSVSSAGDINDDGINDLIIGAIFAGNNSVGQSYVVFGSNNGFSASFELSSLDGSNGFVLNGIAAGDNSGFSVSGAGDINGDGVDDLIIGAISADPNGKSNAGQSYVVFGSSNGFSASLELSSIDGSNGFVLNGVAMDDNSGLSVSEAGDINGDGIDDLIIGARLADPNGKTNAGQSYVVFGSSNGFSASLELSSLDGSNGFILNGINVDDLSGNSVSSVGDINGDGIDDLIIGAHLADPNDKINAGQSYVVFGNRAPELDLNGANAGIDFATAFSGAAVSVTDSNLSLNDNSNNVVGATATITNLQDGVAESLSANTTGTNITAAYDSATGVLTLSGTDTVANYQQVLHSITYNNTAATPNTTDRIIEFVVDDGAAHSNTSQVATTTLAILPSNTEPGNTLATADNLGTLVGSRSFSEFVGLSDTHDYYRFDLATPSNFNLSLSGLSANADVWLIEDLNNNGLVDVGEALASSLAGGSSSEAININNLAAGTYYVLVEQFFGDTNYDLDLSASPLGGIQHHLGTLRSDWFQFAPSSSYKVFSGNGNVDLGNGGLDVLDLSYLSVNAVTNWNLATANGGGVVYDPGNGARVFDALTLSDGSEILFEGIDQIRFADSWQDFTVIPNDPLFDEQWNLHMMGVHNAWRFTTGSSNVLIGVQDSGLGLDSSGNYHQDLRSTLFSNNNNYADDFGEGNASHGTAVQGIIAANTNNGVGMSGINWSSDVFHIDVLGDESGDFQLDAATQAMLDHANLNGQRLVINMSLGVHDSDIGLMPALEQLISNNQDDALFVIASGNEDDSLLSYPAQLAQIYDNVIAVGASWGTQDVFGDSRTPGERISYPNLWGSNYGYGLTLMAASEVIATRAISSNSGVGFDFYSNAPAQNTNEPFNGTSAATPNVAGVASLVWGANPNLSATQVQDILSDTAYDLGVPGYDLFYGHGFINADAAVRQAIALL